MQDSLEIKSIEQLRSANQNLHISEINIKEEKITCHDASIILKMTKSNSLNIVSLRNNIFEKDAIKIIADVIKANNNIEKIEISMDEHEKTPTKILSLMPSIKHLSKLKIFSCNQNCIDDLGIEFIANALSSIISLELFSMSYNKVTVSGASAIAEIIEHNPYLMNVVLDNNFLRNDGARIIGPSLSKLTHLEYFSARNNFIKYEGAEAIYHSIIPHDVTVNLDKNSIAPNKLEALQSAYSMRMGFLKR